MIKIKGHGELRDKFIISLPIFGIPAILMMSPQNLDKINTIVPILFSMIGIIIYIFFIELFIKIFFGSYKIYLNENELIIKDVFLVPIKYRTDIHKIEELTIIDKHNLRIITKTDNENFAFNNSEEAKSSIIALMEQKKMNIS